MEQLMAGVAAGGLSTIICHPIDLVKVRMQMDTTADYRKTVSFMNTFKIMSDMRRSFGLKSLYMGLTANAVGAMSSWGLYFMFYEYFKRKRVFGDSYMASSYMASAALAGATTQLLTNPIWLAKSRLCAQQPDKRLYNGLVDCLQKVYKQGGIRAIYRGLVPGLAGTSHGAIHFSIYEHLKSRLRPKIPQDFIYFSVCSGLSKIGAILATYPFQVIRTRVQVADTLGIMSVCRGLVSGEGVVGLYKGIGPTILRVLPSSCITLVTYEFIIKSLK